MWIMYANRLEKGCQPKCWQLDPLGPTEGSEGRTRGRVHTLEIYVALPWPRIAMLQHKAKVSAFSGVNVYQWQRQYIFGRR